MSKTQRHELYNAWPYLDKYCRHATSNMTTAEWKSLSNWLGDGGDATILGWLTGDIEPRLHEAERMLFGDWGKSKPVTLGEELLSYVSDVRATPETIDRGCGLDKGRAARFISGERDLSISDAMKLANHFGQGTIKRSVS